MSDTRFVPISREQRDAIGTLLNVAGHHMPMPEHEALAWEALDGWDTADVAATHEKIREHAEAIKALSDHAGLSPLGRVTFAVRHAEAILGLLEPSEYTPASPEQLERHFGLEPGSLTEPSEHTHDPDGVLAALADGHDDTCTCQSCYPGWGRTHAPNEKP